MFNLAQLLQKSANIAGNNEKKEKLSDFLEKLSAAYGGIGASSAKASKSTAPGVHTTPNLGALSGEIGVPKTPTPMTQAITTPKVQNNTPTPAAAPVGLAPTKNPGLSAANDASKPTVVANKPQEFARFTNVMGMAPKLARNTGIVDIDGNAYVNPADVELLGKLGFILDVGEYSALEKTGEVLDQYSYIEKIAGVPKAVVKAIDKGDAFSGEFLKDMDYDVPKGYEMKGDLCCPIEKVACLIKEASRLRDNVNITSHSDPSGLQEYKASIGDKQIGNMLVADVEGKGKVVAHSVLEPEFRGMGLGKKLYGEVMRRQPDGVLHSGPVVSDDAMRVWDSLRGNKGYNVAGEAPGLVGKINSKALHIPEKIKKVLASPIAPEVKESLLARIKSLLGKVKKAEAAHELKSSNIKAVGYDKKEKELEVHFHSGGEYKYNDVPANVFHRLLKVKSPGKFFHKHIKKDSPYSYEKIAGRPEWLRKAVLNNDKPTLRVAGQAGARARAANLAAKKKKMELDRYLNMGEEAVPRIVHPPSAYNVQPPLPGI